MLGSSILLFNSFASGDTSDALHEAISPLPTQKHKTNLVRMRWLGAVQKSRNFRQSMHWIQDCEFSYADPESQTPFYLTGESLKGRKVDCRFRSEEASSGEGSLDVVHPDPALLNSSESLVRFDSPNTLFSSFEQFEGTLESGHPDDSKLSSLL